MYTYKRFFAEFLLLFIYIVLVEQS